MTWVAVAVVGGAAIGAIGSGVAAHSQQQGAEAAANTTRDQYNKTVALEQPFTNAGYGAQSQLNYLLGIGPSGGNNGQPLDYNTWAAQQGGNGTQGGYRPNPDGGISRVIPGGSGQNPAASKAAYQKYVAGFQQQNQSGAYGSMLKPFDIDTFHKYSPAYQFQLGQGQQGVLNGDSSNAGALSGAAQKDLIGYNQSFADTSFNNAFNQYNQQQNNIYDRLSGIATRGQNAASGVGTVGSNLAQSTASSQTNAGTAQGAGVMGASNSLSSIAALPWLKSGGSGAGFDTSGGG